MKMPAYSDLTGLVAVVTGGNSGIGRSIALGLAEAGASLAVFGRNLEKKSAGALRIESNRRSFNGGEG